MQEYHNYIRLVGDSMKRKRAAFDIMERCGSSRWDLVEFTMNDGAEEGRRWADSGRSMVDFYSTGAAVDELEGFSNLHNEVAFECELIDLSGECLHTFSILAGKLGTVNTIHEIFDWDGADDDTYEA